MTRFTLAACLALASLTSWASVAWQPFDAGVFERARAEQKLVLLNLEAVWCHWCHVMDATTYVDPRVLERISGFIAVKADHDARPDLANRYRNYGWPATVVFDAEGRELAKRAGYIAPEDMVALLESAPALVPLKAAASVVPGELTDALRDTLRSRHAASLDRERGGLKSAQKFLEADAVEWGLRRAALGDAAEAEHVRRTLDAGLALIDPVWGGAYQYSTGRVWTRPHFERIMRTQARYLRLYALGYQAFRDARYLQAIRDVRRYLAAFLTAADGTFFVSQDADVVRGEHAADYFALDDAARRRIGVPRVDTHVYADANGSAIEALVSVHLATKDHSALVAAERAADRILATHRRPDGSFAHAPRDPLGPYLADNLAMARAFFALFGATQEPRWLARAQSTARYIETHFRAPTGYASGVDNGTPVAPVPNIDENIGVARFAAELQRLLGDPASRRLYDHAMAYLASPAIATKRIAEPGILLADAELRR